MELTLDRSALSEPQAYSESSSNLGRSHLNSKVKNVDPADARIRSVRQKLHEKFEFINDLIDKNADNKALFDEDIDRKLDAASLPKASIKIPPKTDIHKRGVKVGEKPITEAMKEPAKNVQNEKTISES